MWRPLKGLLKTALFALIALLFGIVGCNLWVTGSTAHRVYSDVSSIPYRGVGVVLGTSKKVAPDQENLHFTNRMKAAAKLFDAGKIDLVFVSGYDSKEYYNEPRDMREALLGLGVPDERIRLDVNGERTFESVGRMKEYWGVDSFTVISDGFHVSRAVFIADQKGIEDVVAFAAEPVAVTKSARSRLREWLARVMAVLDVTVLNTQLKKHPDEPATPLPVEFEPREQAGGGEQGGEKSGGSRTP